MLEQNKRLISNLIRLAYGEPHLRSILLPLILEGLDTVQFQTRFARSKTRKEKKKDKRERRDQGRRDKVLSDFMFMSWFKQVLKNETWIDPITEEENNPSTVISKARSGDSESKDWAIQILLKEYEDYLKKEPERASAFEHLHSATTYEEFKKGALALSASISRSGDIKESAKSYCRLLENSLNAGSYTARTNFLTRFIDDQLHDMDKKYSDMAKGSVAIVSQVTQFLPEEMHASAYMWMAESAKLEGWESLRSDFEGARSEEERKKILSSAMKKSASKDTVTALKALALHYAAGGLFMSLGLDDKIFQTPWSDLGEALGNLASGVGGASVEIAKATIDTTLRKIADTAGEKIQKKFSPENEIIKNMITALAETSDSPAGINKDYYRKISKARKRLISATTREEKNDALQEVVGEFQSYLAFGVSEAKGLQDQSLYRKLSEVSRRFSETLTSVGLGVNQKEIRKNNKIYTDSVGDVFRAVEDVVDDDFTDIQYLPDEIVDRAEKTVEELMQMRFASEEAKVVQDKSMRLMLDMMSSNMRKEAQFLVSENAEEITKGVFSQLSKLSSEEGADELYGTLLNNLAQRGREEGLDLQGIKEMMREAQK